MNARRPKMAGWIAVAGVAAVSLGGCVYEKERMVPTQTPVVVTPPPAERVVTAPAPAPVVVAPAPATAQVVVQMDRVVATADGRWQLYGDGSTVSPYYWVWVPNGTSPPAPPPLPRTSQTR
jgi:hypothetical protein